MLHLLERGLHQTADIRFLCDLRSHISSPAELLQRIVTQTGGVKAERVKGKNRLSVVSAL